MKNDNPWEKKLRALCEGLGVYEIDKLIIKTPEDLKKIGQVINQKIREVNYYQQVPYCKCGHVAELCICTKCLGKAIR